jgi:DNA-binding NtrC family response regulator
VAKKALVVCKDLFFTTRIGETAKLAGTAVEFARSRDELEARLAGGPSDLVILDLTTQGWDYDAIFAALERREPRVPVLAFTTHVLAKATRPHHGRCDRVVTKEIFTQELADILKNGVNLLQGVRDDSRGVR